METRVINVDTSNRKCVDLTTELSAFTEGRGDGLLSVFAPHSTVGLAILELGSESDADLEAALERLLPRDDRFYKHAHGAAGHGADHLVPALIGPSLTVPVIAGRPTLGTWQSVVLVDLNVDNPQRQIRLSFLPA
jgi:secondary thiamine-phosphate synthase enzyme